MEWRQGIETCRILLLSAFESSQRRITTTLSEQRNKLVAALVEEVYFADDLFLISKAYPNF
ncbi:MAG: hypothetical protein JW896_14160 [Deltaproteobacteria bacterium]|nr:hypothetical protein [Deltaproteobacteria bacterium]